LALRNATVPACLVDGLPASIVPDRDGLVSLAIRISDGRVASLEPAANDGTDLGGGMVWPCFVDMHTHLDKGHIWPRAENPDGTFDGAVGAAMADRERHWTEADVAARMDWSLRASYAHGTVAVRTHLDSQAPQHAVSWPVFAAMRDKWRGRIALQAVTIVMLERFEGAFGVELADLVAAHGGLLGGVALPAPELDRRLDRLFALAADRGLDLDFHADESDDLDAQALAAIARAKLRHRFPGKVTVGHCCSLAVQDEATVDRTLDLVAEAGLSVVGLPMCNLYLQHRQSTRTPRWRGITLLHELAAHGIAVSVASDNCRDPFYGYGDHDGLEVFTQAVRIAHLDHPFGDWPNAVTRTPAAVMGLEAAGRIAVGLPADLVLFEARRYSELLSRPQTDRIVLRQGKPIDTTLPSYRELDALFA